MRVTSGSTYLSMSAGLNASLGRVQTLQTQLSSGRRINNYSDDPVGAAAALKLHAQAEDWDAYQRNADDAQAVLGTTDSALQTMSTLLRRVHELSISAVDGTSDPASRSAIADEVADLRDQLRDIGNTAHLGRAVFGGFADTAVKADNTTTPPTWSYAGDTGTVKRQVSPTVVLDVNIDGRALFGFSGGAGQDLFSVLGSLETGIRAGDDAAIGADQARLASRTDAVQVALGQVGAKENRVESASQLGQSVLSRLTEQRSNLEDANFAETVLKLNTATTGYQAALGAVARANLPSLADFLH